MRIATNRSVATLMTKGPEFPQPFVRALCWAADRDWKGYDPYDGLLTPLARMPIVGDYGFLRLALIQAVKRFPWSPRRVLAIPRQDNAKGLALFLSAATRAPGSGCEGEPGAFSRTGMGEKIVTLATLLQQARSRGYPGAGWGYPFPWQGRAFYLRAGVPTVVVTAFAGEAFLDAHAATGEHKYLETALEACRFVREALYRTEDASGVCLSYSPLDRTAVYNASLLGARLLTLTGQRTGRPDLVEAARPLISYALARQRLDGSWAYGDARNQSFIDSFHTGFVLGALDVFQRATGDAATEKGIRTGAAFYAERFFGPAGEPYYYAHHHYPLDVHSAAQGVLTFLQLRDRVSGFSERAQLVGRFLINRFLDPTGFFYYQIRRTHTVKIPFMRWSQAWGVRALAEMVRTGLEV